MNEIYIKRFKRGLNTSLAKCRLYGVDFYILENLSKIIPADIYSSSLTYSPRFKCRLPLLHVKNRSGIRVHAGNFFSDSKGCLLVGLGFGRHLNVDGSCDYFVTRSRDALSKFLNFYENRCKILDIDSVNFKIVENYV